MNINLTEELESYVRSKLASGQYNSASEVVREALREKVQQERRDEIESRLQTFVSKGLDLGPPSGVSQQEWDGLRTRVVERFSRQVAVGLAELDRGEGIPGEEVATALRKRLGSYASRKER